MTTTRKPPTNDVALTDTDMLPAVIDHNAIAAAFVNQKPLGDFDDLDMSPEDGNLPLLTMNRKVGQSDSGVLVGNERVLELDFVWAAKSISRAHFGQRYDIDPNARPDCWSNDGLAPSPTIAQPRSTTCTGCPWSFEQTGGGEGPDKTPGCSKNLEALVYLSDDGMFRVARLRFGGIAFSAARAYWDSFRFARPKKYAFQFLTRMRLVSTKTDHGDFLVPSFSRTAQLPDNEALGVGNDAKQLTGTFRSLVSEDIVTAVARETDTAPGPFDDEPAFTGVDEETGEIITVGAPAATTASEPFDFKGVGSDEPF